MEISTIYISKTTPTKIVDVVRSYVYAFGKGLVSVATNATNLTYFEGTHFSIFQKVMHLVETLDRQGWGK